jgi:hypothetical protein
MVTIDYGELTAAFQDSNIFDYSYWLDTESGDVFMIDDWYEEQARELDSPYDTDDRGIRLAWCILWQDGKIGLKEREEEDKKTVDALMEPFVPVPQAEPHEAYELMVDFAVTVEDPCLRELLKAALDGRGAFRRFKDVQIRYPDERERWFTFRDAETRKQVESWLQSVGVLERRNED